jgi:hypothetical protein
MVTYKKGVIVMDFIITFVIVLVILVFAVSIFSFTSTVTTGVYSWSQNQTAENAQYSTTTHKPSKSTRKRKAQPVPASFEDYSGYSEDFEDSEQFKEILDNMDFDVRHFLKRND